MYARNLWHTFTFILSFSLFLSLSLSLSLSQGGNVRQDYSPDDRLSVFNFRGPRGMRVVGLLDDSDADNTGVLDYADAVVAVPSV